VECRQQAWLVDNTLEVGAVLLGANSHVHTKNMVLALASAAWRKGWMVHMKGPEKSCCCCVENTLVVLMMHVVAGHERVSANLQQ
jgi:hypothetical protein